MDIKLKYRAWVGEKHADIASPLTNSDIETYATEFAEWLVKNLAIPDVSNRRGLLFAFLKENENVTIPDYDSNKHLMIDAFLGKQ